MTEVREQGKLEREVILLMVWVFCLVWFLYCYNAIWIKYILKKDFEKRSSQNNFHDGYYFTNF